MNPYESPLGTVTRIDGSQVSLADFNRERSGGLKATPIQPVAQAKAAPQPFTKPQVSFGNTNLAMPKSPAQETKAPQTGVEVPGRKGYYVPPGASQYSPKPGLLERMSRAFGTRNVLTEDLMAEARGYTPALYNEMRAKRASGGHTLPQPPASTGMEKAAEYAGGLAKEVTDPLGWIAALGGPVSAAIGGTAYAGAKEAMNQRMRTGEVQDLGDVAIQAGAGGVGAAVGGKFFAPHGGGTTALEIAENATRANTVGGAVEERTASAGDNVFRGEKAPSRKVYYPNLGAVQPSKLTAPYENPFGVLNAPVKKELPRDWGLNEADEFRKTLDYSRPKT